ncbi:hypothetical protein [Azospirillum doebereinerae]|uniref:hypothetical protein n=1 Tax=Azospirillum doebereinerae TaxID=92933 RepID=UPI001FD00CBA|nr:hypothetical protein [Azospirillum doebereinerae]
MPHDFGSFGSRDRRPATGSGSGIGFHELRQACEISTLREDLERLSHEAGALRGSVEEAVEEIRDRFAALTAQEMTDAAAMAPLLQFAVSTLLDIREQTRRLHTQTGPVADDERSSWLGAADAPRVRPSNPPPSNPPLANPPLANPPPANAVTTPCAPAPLPPRNEPPPLPKAAPFPSGPSPKAMEPLAPSPVPAPTGAAAPPMTASWLASRPAPPSPPPRAAVVRSAGSPPTPPGGIDWLGRAGR